MPQRPYLQHARRHSRRGSDPIPGVGVEYLFASFNTGYDSSGAQSVAATSELDLAWHSMETSNQAVFATHTLPTGTPNNAAGDKWVQLLEAGMYIAYTSVLWESGSFGRYADITSNNGIAIKEFSSGANPIVQDEQATTSTSVHAAYPLVTRSIELIILPSDYVGSGAVKVVAGNQDSVAHNVTSATVGVYYLGGGDFSTETNYTVY